jgi:hypothetical protein
MLGVITDELSLRFDIVRFELAVPTGSGEEACSYEDY